MRESQLKNYTASIVKHMQHLGMDTSMVLVTAETPLHLTIRVDNKIVAKAQVYGAGLMVVFEPELATK